MRGARRKDIVTHEQTERDGTGRLTWPAAMQGAQARPPAHLVLNFYPARLTWCCSLATARPAQLLQRCAASALSSGKAKELSATVCRKACACSNRTTQSTHKLTPLLPNRNYQPHQGGFFTFCRPSDSCLQPLINSS